MEKEAIMQAVARGWCHEKNSKKVMDTDLAIAISDEVVAALDKAVLGEDVLFERIWQAIKHWDIDNGKKIKGTNIGGYAGINGDDVKVIIDAITKPVEIVARKKKR